MNIYPQQSPFSVQVELAEGCQLACSFCGINGIRESPGKEYKFMTQVTLTSLITQIKNFGWNPRIEFALHGEPTMHPQYLDMIKLAYEIQPKLHLMMTTNGGGLIRGDIPKNIQGLFQNGLNILALDDYVGIKIVGKIRPHLDEICKDLGIRWYEYPRDPEGNPHQRGNVFITILKDISQSTSGTHSHLSNHTGAAGPLDLSSNGKRCHRPFREMSVRWDGNVAICCDDWRGKYKCGNVVTDGLEAVWLSPQFEAARRKLLRGERDFGPCLGCTSQSLRVGLLPDKKGQDRMDPPDEESNTWIQQALDKDPYTKPVLRPWEM
jgi:hypothetical protein